MDTVTYPDSRVAEFLSDHFVPLRVMVKDQPELTDSYGVTWTPTIAVADEQGKVHYRLEGYIPPDDFTGYLALGLARYLFDQQKFDQAVHYYQQVTERHAGTDVGAEGLYWLGVARYKQSKNPDKLQEAWARLIQQYPDSQWAKRANVPKTS